MKKISFTELMGMSIVCIIMTITLVCLAVDDNARHQLAVKSFWLGMGLASSIALTVAFMVSLQKKYQSDRSNESRAIEEAESAV